MGITFSAIQKMDELGLFGGGSVSVLDIGSSNLYSAKTEQIEAFLRKYRKDPHSDLSGFCERIAAGSAYDPVGGGSNEAFVGELFEQAGMRYASFDIASGYRTTIIDLNHANLAQELQGAFDLVLNFGTTEHILNQLNCFKVIHDATKVGGYIYHSLPAVGYVDHGYITYTGRCFFDVAGFNEYEVVACWFDGPTEGGSSMLESLQSYSSYFPVLGEVVERMMQTEEGRALRDLRVPDIGINVVYQKTQDRPFVGAIEFSTSVGNIPDTVTSTYGGTSEEKVTIESVPNDDLLTKNERRLRHRLLAGNATRDEGLQLYSSMTARGIAFPLAWEEIVLGLCLEQEPERADLKLRLRKVLAMQGKT